MKQDDCFLLDQQKYILNIAAKFQLSDAKNSNIPLNPSYQKEPNEDIMANNDKYHSAIGHLLYISTNTCPDIAAAICILSQKISKPTSDWNQVKKLIRYLKGTFTLRLKLGDVKGNENLIGFVDASWAEDRKTRKFNSGFIFMFGGAISWSFKQLHRFILNGSGIYRTF